MNLAKHEILYWYLQNLFEVERKAIHLVGWRKTIFSLNNNNTWILLTCYGKNFVASSGYARNNAFNNKGTRVGLCTQDKVHKQ